MELKRLFEPIQIRGMKVKNRIVKAPQILNIAAPDGSITQRLLNHYAETAQGGTGLVVVEASYIHPLGEGSYHAQLGIYDDKLINGLAELADTICRNGAKSSLQLQHAGRATHMRVTGQQPMAPSPIPCPACRDMPRELGLEEIEELVEAYALAAQRAKQAGFDAVTIHGAHGYLISNFLSPHSNKRIDCYGGDLRGRMNFALEIVKKTREKIGEDFPILFRMNGKDFVKGGLELEDTIIIAKELEKAGVDCLDISAGEYQSSDRIIPTMYYPSGCNVYLAERIKKNVSIPVITAGKIDGPELAEKILEEGKADMVAFGRALIADPSMPDKAKEGRSDEIRPCIYCNDGCLSGLFLYKPSKCTVNYMAIGRSKEEDFRIFPSQQEKRVLVVGGGPAGMETAHVLAQRGHEVMLVEKVDNLGGQLILASKIPFKKDLGKLMAYLANQVKRHGVKVELGKEVTTGYVEEISPDAVVIATGSKPYVPEFPGIHSPWVHRVEDVLWGGKASLEGKVIVMGGGMVGCEVAVFLADKGMEVSIVELTDRFAADAEEVTKMTLRGIMAEKEIRVLTGKKGVEIGKDGIICYDKEEVWEEIRADSVVIAMGRVPQDELFYSLQGKVKELYSVGDCVTPGKIIHAIHQGSLLARRI